MPTTGKAWHHIIFNTRGSWLTGDPRGFRSRNHRKHSDGDYKAPPPLGQHAGLYQHIKTHSRPALKLPKKLPPVIGEAIRTKCQAQGHRVLVIAVDPTHVHVLVELPINRKVAKQIIGAWKQKASHAVHSEMPGTIWSKSCDPIQIQDRSHQARVYRYIADHADQGAWVWTFRDPTC